MAAVEWILFMQEKPFFKDYTIRHALNGGEVEMTLEGRHFRPDGFVIINNVKHFLCFDGKIKIISYLILFRMSCS